MESYNEGDGYTDAEDGFEGVAKSYRYLENRFGRVEAPLESYISDSYIADLLQDIHRKDVKWQREELRKEVYSSMTYKISRALSKPFAWLKR